MTVAGRCSSMDPHPPGMRRLLLRSSRPATFFHGVWSRKIISTVILFLPLIQKGQLSVTGERMCTLSTGKLSRRLAQEQCG